MWKVLHLLHELNDWMGRARFRALLVLLAMLVPALSAPAQAHGARQACIMVYDPVCAEVRIDTGLRIIRQRRTFSNACFAHAAGARIIHRGRCRKARRHHRRPVYRVPRRCRVWFDGCNVCVRARPGARLACTRRYCARYRRPHCRRWFPRHRAGQRVRYHLSIGYAVGTTRPWRPVCARRLVRVRHGWGHYRWRWVAGTYATAWRARRVGAVIVHHGACRRW